MSTRSYFRLARFLVPAVSVLACRAPATLTPHPESGMRRLPTGMRLDPVRASSALGSMPLAIIPAPDGRRAVVVLSGWREQGIQVVDLATRHVVQTLLQPAAFVGAAFAPNGRELYVSGGNQDVVYRYAWAADTAALVDSLILARKQTPHASGTRYPAGIKIDATGRTLYVAENLSDSLAVIDIPTRRVVQRLATGRYPYDVAVAPDGHVFVSVWDDSTVVAFAPGTNGLTLERRIAAGRHPSALLLDSARRRLFVTSASTDRVTVLDAATGAPIAVLHDAPPAGPAEGSTPNALALSANGSRLFVAEADNNAVAVFALDALTRMSASTGRIDRAPVGRIPVDWYPTGLLASGDSLFVVTGKGLGTGPNPDGPTPTNGRENGSRAYTLGQTTGSLLAVPLADATGASLDALTARVARANGWSAPRASAARAYPPFTHVIYIIKENRTYDQVLGDLPIGDGDTSLVFFPRAVSPNHHALAERFGAFDRFFTNAEVSPDGHNWSTAAYATDYVEKTIPSEYSGRGRSYDYEGTNRGFGPASIPNDDVAAPALGYLWDAAARAGITYRDYGEFVVNENDAHPHEPGRYAGDKKALDGHTSPDYAGFDLAITDQSRINVWLREFAGFVRDGNLPTFEIVRLPNDHTSGTRVGTPTPRAYMADNDLALGRLVQAVSSSPYWRNTVIFVVEDDAQNGPDHVDSHRSVAFAISAYSPHGVVHRWTNTTDILATISGILHLDPLSQFAFYGRPLREIWTAHPDLQPYKALTSGVDLNERNARDAPGAAASARLDLTAEDRADENSFNRILWYAIKGSDRPYPGIVRMPTVTIDDR